MKRMFAFLVLLSSLVVLACPAHAQFTRPDPWADIRQFGAYATYSSTTATTTSDRPTVTLASAQSFKNGEYVTVYNAGATDCTHAMGTVRLTPSLNAGGFNTVAAGTGASTFNYKVIAAGKFGCYTAASAAVMTSKGNALGKRSINISAFSRSGQTVTVTTSTAHPFVVGSEVNIQYFGGNADSSFWGFFIVNAVTDNTHFTYRQNLDSAGGATTSDKGGTAIAILCNHLTWTPVTGAWKYYVYGRSGGTYGLLGVTMEPYFDDYGSPMNDNRVFPPFIPTTAPSIGANDHLTAKILLGGGTTSLTLASNAGASLAGAGIRSDDGPAIAAAARVGNELNVYIPYLGTNYPIVNSYTVLAQGAGQSRRLMFGGSIILNDTLEATAWGFESWGVGSPVAFSWQGAAGMAGSCAYPMIALNGGPNIFRYTQVSCSAANGCLDIWDLGSVNDSFEYATLSTGGGSSDDYLGQHAIFGYGSFSFRFDKTLFITGSPGPNSTVSIGNSFTPTVIFKLSSGNTANAPSGNWMVKSSWFVARSSFEQDFPSNSGGGNYITMDDIQTQNSFLPILEYTGASNSPGFTWELNNITPADFPTAMVANLSSSNITLNGLSLSNSTGPNQTGLFMTGAPIATVLLHNAAGGLLGLNRDYGSPATGQFPNLAVTTNNMGSVGYLLSRPTAPKVVVGAHGSCSSNCVLAGRYYYAFAAADTAGHYSATSPPSSAATTDGTQTITVSWTPVTGQVLAYVARGTSPSNMVFRGDFGGAGYSGTGYTDLGGTSYSCSYPCASAALPSGLSSGANSSGLTTQQLTLTGGGFSNREFGTFTANRARTVQDASGTESLTIASGTATLGTFSISANSCARAVTVTAKDVLPTDTLIVTPNAAPASNYASLTLSNSYPTSGSVNILVCNPTSGSLTPGAATVNWRVVR